MIEYPVVPLEYLTPQQTAEMLHMSQINLAKMRMRGEGPRYSKIGHKSLLYRRLDVEAWVEARAVETTRSEIIGLEDLGL